jgi:hypothetical protein
VTELRAVGSPGNATGNSMFNIVKRWQFMLVVVQVLKNDQHRRRCVFIQGRRISKADAAMSRWVIAAGLKLIVVPVDSTWMRRSLANGSRARASHPSRARAGRSRQRESKWAGSTRSAPERRW